MDTLIETNLPIVATATARQPLLGLTILLVEDSRYCSEAVRLLCQKSGARLRRADSQRAAYRHLATYRPSLVIVDIGLPDGSGLDVVRDLSSRRSTGPKILATSGDDPNLCAPKALAAGADGFLAKPLKNIQSFQADVLKLFPERPVPDRRKIIPFMAEVEPDGLALSEDIRHARDLVSTALEHGDDETIAYCAQFLQSVAEANENQWIKTIAARLATSLSQGQLEKEQIMTALQDLTIMVERSAQI